MIPYEKSLVMQMENGARTGEQFGDRTGRGVHSDSFAINHTFDYIIRESKVGCVSGSRGINDHCCTSLLHSRDIIAALLIYATYRATTSGTPINSLSSSFAKRVWRTGRMQRSLIAHKKLRKILLFVA